MAKAKQSADGISQFLKQAESYFRWWRIEGLRGQRIDRARPDATEVLAAHEKKMDAQVELKKIGPALAVDLEAQDEDPSTLLLFLHMVGSMGGGGPGVAWEVWPTLKVQLQRTAIRIGSRETVGFKPGSQKQRKAKWVAEAMLLVRDHPDWSDAKIAGQVGRDAAQLSRCPEYRVAAGYARERRIPKGFLSTDPDTKVRSVEAIDPDDAE